MQLTKDHKIKPNVKQTSQIIGRKMKIDILRGLITNNPHVCFYDIRTIQNWSAKLEMYLRQYAPSEDSD